MHKNIIFTPLWVGGVDFVNMRFIFFQLSTSFKQFLFFIWRVGSQTVKIDSQSYIVILGQEQEI